MANKKLNSGEELKLKLARKVCEKYADAECELKFNSTFELLVAVILSAQCTDMPYSGSL